MLLKQDFALVDEDGGVDSRLAGAGRRRERDADEEGGGQRRGGLAEFFNDADAAGEKAGLVEEVGGRIAAQDQLGEDGETCAGTSGALSGADDFCQISGEVSDGGVDLGEGNLHSFSLMQRRGRSTG